MISGLIYIPNFLSRTDANNLLDCIDDAMWRDDLKRRVQHYGYVYDYRRRTATKDMALGALPRWLESMVDRLTSHADFGIEPDQIIVNEYEPGQGIAHHVDCEPCFGDMIASLSLNSTCMMSFVHVETKATKHLLLEPNSLLIMRGEARYDWKHGIPARKKDIIDGVAYHRKRRVSVTFRKVILADG